MKHNHGPTEWCSRCPGEWLEGDIGYNPRPDTAFESAIKKLKSSGNILVVTKDQKIEIVWPRKKIEFPQGKIGKPLISNITRLSPSRITTEFGSIRP